MTTILESPARESNDRPGDLPVGKPLILVIDDERVVREALAEILEKVVVTSGYAEAETMGRFAGSSPDSPLPGFLQKPYDIDALLATVRRML